MGRPLFERVAKRRLATDSGERLAAVAEEVLPQVEAVELELRQAPARPS